MNYEIELQFLEFKMCIKIKKISNESRIKERFLEFILSHVRGYTSIRPNHVVLDLTILQVPNQQGDTLRNDHNHS